LNSQETSKNFNFPKKTSKITTFLKKISNISTFPKNPKSIAKKSSSTKNFPKTKNFQLFHKNQQQVKKRREKKEAGKTLCELIPTFLFLRFRSLLEDLLLFILRRGENFGASL
jgi:hypothetical protein